MKKLSTILLVFLITLALGLPTVQAAEYTFPFQKVLQTGDTVKLSVTCPVGNIEVRAGEATQVVIDATRRIKAASQEEAAEAADDLQLDIRQDINTVTITADMLQLDRQDKSFLKKLLGGGAETRASIDLVIQVPVDCEISIENATGSISVAETRGKVSIRSSVGDISLSGIQGNMDIDNANGSTAGDLLFGDVTIRQAMGKVALQWVEGDLRIKSTSADIDIKQEKGSLDLMTGSGNVRVQTSLDSPRDFFVETESGNIELLIPVGSPGTLRMASETGDIKTEIPVTVKSVSKKQMIGEMGSGGVKITLTSASGDVSVAEF